MQDLVWKFWLIDSQSTSFPLQKKWHISNILRLEKRTKPSAKTPLTSHCTKQPSWNYVKGLEYANKIYISQKSVLIARLETVLKSIIRATNVNNVNFNSCDFFNDMEDILRNLEDSTMISYIAYQMTRHPKISLNYSLIWKIKLTKKSTNRTKWCKICHQQLWSQVFKTCHQQLRPSACQQQSSTAATFINDTNFSSLEWQEHQQKKTTTKTTKTAKTKILTKKTHSMVFATNQLHGK